MLILDVSGRKSVLETQRNISVHLVPLFIFMQITIGAPLGGGRPKQQEGGGGASSWLACVSALVPTQH